MTSALQLLNRALNRLDLMYKTGDVSEMQCVINEINTAGDILIHVITKKGCLRCLPTGRITNE